MQLCLSRNGGGEGRREIVGRYGYGSRCCLVLIHRFMLHNSEEKVVRRRRGLSRRDKLLEEIN